MFNRYQYNQNVSYTTAFETKGIEKKLSEIKDCLTGPPDLIDFNVVTFNKLLLQSDCGRYTIVFRPTSYCPARRGTAHEVSIYFEGALVRCYFCYLLDLGDSQTQAAGHIKDAQQWCIENYKLVNPQLAESIVC